MYESVSLYDDVGQEAGKLSGGQRQRLAVARMLLKDADIILADEPTGNLDKKSADEIMELLLRLNSMGVTILLVTHNEQYATLCSRVFRITDGIVEEETRDRETT